LEVSRFRESSKRSNLEVSKLLANHKTASGLSRKSGGSEPKNGPWPRKTIYYQYLLTYLQKSYV
jgi:hypothetical protein